MELSSKNSSKEAIRTTQLGIIISIALIFIKGLSGYLGHSYALIADATESGADVVSSGLLWLALIYAQRPADQGHPYGHGKAEPIAALLIGLFLIAAAGWIGYHSIYYIRTPHGLPKSYTLIVLLVVILSKELLFRYVLKIGKRLNSQAVKADAYHHRSDAITSIAAFIGIVIALVLGKGYEGADDWAALMACVFIIYNAIKIIRPAFSEIMDAAPSPSFRRLQGKTQLYPGIESDFFRNRLTHSLEVAQISKTIALLINSKYLKGNGDNQIDPDICEFAGIAHDLGHPPFGHQGEEALDDCMADFGGFEGNAQTLRILTRIEKKQQLENPVNNIEYRFGLNLTYRSLASVLKYDNAIPSVRDDRDEEDKKKAVKGYYAFDTELVKRIKQHVVGEVEGKFKTVECKIMDIADDIAYSTYDLEDGFKAGFYHPTIFFTYPDAVFENVAKKVERALKKDENIKKKVFTANEVREELFSVFSSVYNFDAFKLNVVEDKDGNEYIAIDKDKSKEAMLSNIVNDITRASKNIAEDGYLRNSFTSELVNNAVEGVEFKFNKKHPAMSEVYLEEKTRIRVEVLKNFTYESQILSPRLKVAEFRGKEIIKFIFDVLKEDEGWRLMPSDYQTIYHHFTDIQDKYRCICDFIAGMTDKYAIEFYGRLKSENPETIFKPF